MSTRTAYTVSVDGAPLPAEAVNLLQRVELEEHLRLADVLRLRFGTAPRADAGGWELLDDRLFPRLAAVRLEVTMSGTHRLTFEGHVVETSAVFSTGPEGSTFTVVAFDPSVLLHLESRTRAWPDMSDADIAGAVYEEHGLQPRVQPTQPTRAETDETVLQTETDMQLLRRLAHRNGYECYVDTEAGGRPTGHFHTAELEAEPQGVLSVGLGAQSNLAKLQIQHDMLRPVHVTAGNLHSATLEPHVVTVDSVAATGLGRETVLPADRPRVLLARDIALELVPDLTTYAQAVTDRSAMALRAEGDVSGEAYGGLIRARRPILVRGAGPSWNGTYLVERVLHVLSGADHTQSFALIRNATGLGGTEDFRTEGP